MKYAGNMDCVNQESWAAVRLEAWSCCLMSAWNMS